MITFDEKKYPQITDAEIKDALQFSTEQVIRDLPEFTEKFQKAYSENGFYQPIPNNYWTCGFWTGEIWLAYEYSQDERLKKAGEVQVKSFLDRIDKKIEVDHHDMGFLYSPSCVAAYKLTGSQRGQRSSHQGSRPAHHQISSGRGVYSGMGTHGCTGELPPDH